MSNGSKSSEELACNQDQLALIKIKKLYDAIIPPSEVEEKTHHASSGLNLFMVCIAEIGIPFITGFVGMHDVLTEYFLSYLSTVIIYCVAAILASIDAAVNSALLIPMFRGILKTPEPAPVTIEELKKQQLIFYKKILNKLTDPAFYNGLSYEDYEKYYRQINSFYDDIIKNPKINSPSSSDSTQDQVIAFLKGVLKWFLITVFLALRASGGYFILSKFLIVISLSGFIATVPGVIIVGIAIGLFLYAGYQTRHDAIDDLIYAKEKEASELNKKIDKISALYAIKKDHMELVLKNKDSSFKSDDKSIEQQPRSFKSCEVNNREEDYLLVRGFESLGNLIDNKKDLEGKNKVYNVYKNSAVLNKHRHRYVDQLLFYQHTSLWKTEIKKIREDAYNFLQESIQDKKPEEKIAELKKAKQMPIFNEHRTNWRLFGAFGRTATVKAIEQKIDEIQAGQKVLRVQSSGS